MDAGGDGREGDTWRRLRVLVVIKCLHRGGAERLLVDTVATGDRTSFDYEVAYVLDAEDDFVPEIRDSGTPVHSLGSARSTDLAWMSRLRKLLRSGSFDIVHFHLPYTAALGRMVVASMPRRRRPAVVYTEHSLWNKAAIITRGLNRAGVGRDQSLIVVSEAAHDALPGALRDRAQVVVHGLDVSQADGLIAQRGRLRVDVRSELGVPEGDALVVTVANLRPEKGYDVLLDAARILADRQVPVHVVAAGRGPLETEMHERRDELGLVGRLQFLGERDDVLRLLAGSDVFVLPSRQEGLPVSLMEATSMGMAIVATAVGGVPQVITDGVNGLIVAPGEPGPLADAISQVVADPDLRGRLGKEAKVTSEMFDVTKASRQIEGIYNDIAGSRRTSSG